ncbi:ankyrin repeat domain-containing protein [Wolbachia endosymbiont of Wuchereria bancrofti]|uniref:ankyrin repeat domain-containing protein n=1 Tax=Wolbachia endosymbiont of Wuchereria bancrofti TaxID=96496 RepID=UPI001FEB1544|nr:ankyrin repeat domain-containing protein [Wolbachia endosymbiont of Wuchereria bancrofti]
MLGIFMRSVLYFTLLFVVFGSLNLFAVEQVEEKKTDADESVDSVHENVGVKKDLKQDLLAKEKRFGVDESVGSVYEDVGIRKNPKQDLLKNTTQRGDELKSSRSDSANVDKLNAEGIQDTKIEGATNKKKLQHDKNKVPPIEKVVSGDEKISKDLLDLSNNPLEKSTDRPAQDLPDVASEEVKKDVKKEPSSADLNEDIANQQIDLQVDKKVDVEKSKPSESNASQLLKEKKEKAEDQAGKEKVEKVTGDLNGKDREKLITKKDEESKQEEKENLQKWTKLDREPIKEWCHKNAQSKSIYKRQYDNLNEHLPTTIFIDDYSKQLFYCIKKNNLVCLRGIINKLEEFGSTVREILEFRNKLGDTPLIYAVKQGKIDIIRFLLLQGANPKVVNNNFQSPIDIAIEKEQVDIINAIAEMIPHLLEHKKVDNKESQMYDWAVKTKKDNELQCNED